MASEFECKNDILAKMLQEALTFDGKFESEEFSRFKEGFAGTVNEFAREMGYRNREEMLCRLEAIKPEELLSEIEAINSYLKEQSSKHMAKVVELYYNGGMKDQGLRSFTQVILQRLRKSISSAESEVARLIAEILYSFVTLATLRI